MLTRRRLTYDPVGSPIVGSLIGVTAGVCFITFRQSIAPAMARGHRGPGARFRRLADVGRMFCLVFGVALLLAGCAGLIAAAVE
jgi:hypothetical protein